MALAKKKVYTAEDYWNLPDGVRAELINGQFYDMAPPSRIHQRISDRVIYRINRYIEEKKGLCQVYAAPFAVNLYTDDSTYVEPDISVICDEKKLTDRGCEGAPDWIIEIVSPGSIRHDYSTKNFLYAEAGVREYWIIDPLKEQTMVYRYENNSSPDMFSFDKSISVAIYEDLEIKIADLI